jgi:hypothetical protein
MGKLERVVVKEVVNSYFTHAFSSRPANRFGNEHTEIIPTVRDE